MVLQQPPAEEHTNGKDPSHEGGAEASIEGLFAWHEGAGFLAPKEMLTFGGLPEEYVPRGILTQEEREDRLIHMADQMLAETGRIDHIRLDQYDTMLSASVDGRAREQVVEIATAGMLRRMMRRASGMRDDDDDGRGGVRGMFRRGRGGIQ